MVRLQTNFTMGIISSFYIVFISNTIYLKSLDFLFCYVVLRVVLA